VAVETTLVLVKPDGVRRGLCGEIVARFERRGYDLRGARLLKVSKPLAREHYAEHRGKPFFGDLVDFITSGPVLALAVRGEDAIAGVRGLMGATNPADSAPGTIRGDLATLLSENVVHGSDSRAIRVVDAHTYPTERLRHPRSSLIESGAPSVRPRGHARCAGAKRPSNVRRWLRVG